MVNNMPSFNHLNQITLGISFIFVSHILSTTTMRLIRNIITVLPFISLVLILVVSAIPQSSHQLPLAHQKESLQDAGEYRVLSWSVDQSDPSSSSASGDNPYLM
jgi:hypothetical protein